MRAHFIAFVLLCFGSAIQAQTATDLRAIGLLTPGAKGGCTATLIAPDLVVTAAHCLLARVDGVRNPPTEYTFYPSTPTALLADGYAGRSYMAHPIYLLPGFALWTKLPRDLGLLRLAMPVPADLATPMGIGPTPDDGTARIISFRGHRGMAFDRPCPVLNSGAVLTLGCEVRGGESGAPVLAERDGVVSLVAVFSSRSTFDGKPIALAAPLGEPFTSLMTAFRNVKPSN